MLSEPSKILPVPANRIRRTLGFIDLSGFTTFNNIEGDDSAVEQLAYFRAIVRSVCSSAGVRIAKWLGDGAMLVALDPVAMASTILKIMRGFEEQGLKLALHAGVAEGDVILFEGDDHIGATVNLAARLAELAKPGEVLAPSTILPGLSRSAAVQGDLEVAGFEQPIRVADLTKAAALVAALDL